VAKAVGLLRCPHLRFVRLRERSRYWVGLLVEVFLQGVKVMLRKVIAASLVLVLSAGVVFADEIRVLITKVEDNKVSFYKLEGKGKETKKSGDEITLPVAKSVKVVRAKFNKETKMIEAGDELPDGLKDKRFAEISEKGVPAFIITEDKKIAEIRVFGGKKKQ
jgi:hypothetical protein